jgi:perosamine synthetase
MTSESGNPADYPAAADISGSASSDGLFAEHDVRDAAGWPISDPAIQQVLEQMFLDGSWGRYHGPHCKRLSHALQEYHQVPHVVLCSSGTSAVELALRALNLAPGDEVILCAYDFKANFMNVLTVGAVPVLVDVIPGRPVMDPEQLQSALTARTRAILCSHLHGNFAPLKSILKFAETHGLVVIEDACQATGAKMNGIRAGALGHIGVLSFGGSKLLTAGRGGAVLTRDPVLLQRIRLYQQRGNEAYPLSEMQAAVLLPQLQQLDARNHLRSQRARRLVQQLNGDCTLKPVVHLSSCESTDLSAYYKFALRWTGCTDRKITTEASERCRNKGIALDPALPALHETHSRRRFRAVGTLAGATQLHHSLMTLHHPVLLSESVVIDRLAMTLGEMFAEHPPE